MEDDRDCRIEYIAGLKISIIGTNLPWPGNIGDTKVALAWELRGY